VQQNCKHTSSSYFWSAVKEQFIRMTEAALHILAWLLELVTQLNCVNRICL